MSEDKTPQQIFQESHPKIKDLQQTQTSENKEQTQEQADDAKSQKNKKPVGIPIAGIINGTYGSGGPDRQF